MPIATGARRHERDGDDAVPTRPAERELRRLHPRGRADRRVGAAPGERNARADDLVCAGHELGVEARIRVVEQEQQRLAAPPASTPAKAAAAARLAAPRGSCEAPSPSPTPTSTSSSNASAAQPSAHHRARGDDPVARHPGPRHVGRRRGRLLDCRPPAQRRRREDEHEARRPPQPVAAPAHRVAYGVRPDGNARRSVTGAQCRRHLDPPAIPRDRRTPTTSSDATRFAHRRVYSSGECPSSSVRERRNGSDRVRARREAARPRLPARSDDRAGSAGRRTRRRAADRRSLVRSLVRRLVRAAAAGVHGRRHRQRGRLRRRTHRSASTGSPDGSSGRSPTWAATTTPSSRWPTPRTTENVAAVERANPAFFSDSPWLNHYDAVFADFYFTAWNAWRTVRQRAAGVGDRVRRRRPAGRPPRRATCCSA